MSTDPASLRLLLSLMAAHFLVDTVATVINPLWPTLQSQTGSSDAAFLWLFLCWNIATSVMQVVFGLLGDRIHGRWLLWGGPVTAVVCLSLVGYTQSLGLLCLLVSCAGLGIAAFHPEAALLAGNTLPSHRSRALSLFQFSGFLGQAAGPYYSGSIVHHWGTAGLLPGLCWMVVMIGTMRFALRSPAGHAASPVMAPVRLREVFQGHVTRVLILLAVNVLRIIPAAGVPMALAFLESARHSSTAEIGLVQSAFLFSVGGGGLYCGIFMSRSEDQWLLWLLPLVAAPLLWCIPGTSGYLLLVISSVAGLLLGATLPVLISLGQQLLPHSPRVGSSITMGLSWGLGGGVAGLIVMGLKPSAAIEQAFPWFALYAVASSLLCIGLLKQEKPQSPASATPGHR